VVSYGGPQAVPDENRIDRALLAVSSVVVLGTIMSILDVTVVNVAINTLAIEFHTSLTTIQWVATGYTLALATVIPLSGWIADRFGTKRLYMISIALFLAGSALSGLAWSAGSLILFRAQTQAEPRHRERARAGPCLTPRWRQRPRLAVVT
jgi:predicted MFS family arabinose efflux permease